MRRTLPVLAATALSLTITAESVAAGYATRTLKVGSSGSDVRVLQRYLDTAGFDTDVDGQFGPGTRRSVMSFETAESRRANGKASTTEQRLVQARAEAAPEAPVSPVPAPTAPTAPTAPVEKAYLGADGLAVAPASAPPEVQAIIAAGNAIATAPYKYGGGHGRWVDSGYDCSGSVSYVLHAAGLLDTALDSSGLMDWGESGRGTWVTIRSNPGHAYMIVAGLRFDTSARRAAGNRWSAQMRSARGYTARHPEGL
jgi:peptidoglycan hydrolase-like protein with peptidoglycan-binding domain